VGGIIQIGGSTVASALGGAGGAPGTGDIAAAGRQGGWSLRTGAAVGISGEGGSGPFGGGGKSIGLAGTGSPGTGYGAGGGGAVSYSAAVNAGGAGSAGVVRITEFK
jgi:hypothetical protein